MATKTYTLTWKDLTSETFDRIAKSFDATMLREMLINKSTALRLEILYGDQLEKQNASRISSNGIPVSDMQIGVGEAWIDDAFVSSTGTGKLYETEKPHELSTEEKIPNRYFVKLHDGTIQQRFLNTGTQLSVPVKPENIDTQPKLDTRTVQIQENEIVNQPKEAGKGGAINAARRGMKYKLFSTKELDGMRQFVMERFVEFGGDMSVKDIREELQINSYRFRKLKEEAKAELAK